MRQRLATGMYSQDTVIPETISISPRASEQSEQDLVALVKKVQTQSQQSNKSFGSMSEGPSMRDVALSQRQPVSPKADLITR